jgi:membrane-associated protease RseP (regulator of RpoE activity)
MIAFWETVTRRPLSTRARMVISYAGLACLVFIMLFVFKNDLQRYWVDIADWING